MPFEMQGYKHFLHYVLCFAPIQSDPRSSAARPLAEPGSGSGEGFGKPKRFPQSPRA